MANEDIIELDQINMSDVMREAGLSFDPEARRIRLEKELSFGSRLIRVRRGGVLVAYLQYLARPDRLADFQSIQIHPKYRHNSSVIREIARAAHMLVSESSPRLIRSTVHISNNRSISLHRKLGFRENGTRPAQIVFEIEPINFLERIDALIRDSRTFQK
jgi:ribosomal protein S18 acetylase RimI-like enzyme